MYRDPARISFKKSKYVARSEPATFFHGQILETYSATIGNPSQPLPSISRIIGASRSEPHTSDVNRDFPFV